MDLMFYQKSLLCTASTRLIIGGGGRSGSQWQMPLMQSDKDEAQKDMYRCSQDISARPESAKGNIPAALRGLDAPL